MAERGDTAKLTSVEIDGVEYEAPHEVLALLESVSEERDDLLTVWEGDWTYHNLCTPEGWKVGKRNQHPSNFICVCEDKPSAVAIANALNLAQVAMKEEG
jgi:hypothetical protein